MLRRSLSAGLARAAAGGVRRAHSARSIVFSEYGPPKEVLSAVRHEVPAPEGADVVLRLVAAPVNPSDLNQIEGVYPSKPRFATGIAGTAREVAVPGNEGVFEVVEAGPDAEGLAAGDWVLPRAPAFGTWATHRRAAAADLFRIGNRRGLDAVQAATVAVNPLSAYRMLQDFADLEPGDFVIQNGGNSGVGRMAIQLARLWGYRTISVVRDRRDIEALKTELTELGADYVVTEEQIADRSIKHVIQDWTRGSPIKLALNCVGGRSAGNIARQLGQGGVLVTYGGMSRQPVALGTAMYIFKDIVSRGFWVSRWSAEHPKERDAALNSLLDMFRQNELRVTGTATREIAADGSEADLLEAFEQAIDDGGKHVLQLAKAKDEKKEG